MYKIKVIDKI